MSGVECWAPLRHACYIGASINASRCTRTCASKGDPIKTSDGLPETTQRHLTRVGLHHVHGLAPCPWSCCSLHHVHGLTPCPWSYTICPWSCCSLHHVHGLAAAYTMSMVLHHVHGLAAA